MTVYALIPARGGSQRLPRKNLAIVGGLTLVARAVRAAKSSRLIDAVWVSTDDGEITAAAMNESALILARPDELAQDETPMEAVVAHFIEYVVLHADDVIVLLEPTAPLRTREDIDAAVYALQRSGAPAVRLVSSLPFLKGCHPAFYRDAGLANVLRADTLRRSGCLFPQGTLMLHHGDDRAIDVDDEFDLERARALAQ